MGRCPKCEINLSNESFESIKNRNGEELAMKMIFGGCFYSNDENKMGEDTKKKGYCELCGALWEDIVMDAL